MRSKLKKPELKFLIGEEVYYVNDYWSKSCPVLLTCTIQKIIITREYGIQYFDQEDNEIKDIFKTKVEASYFLLNKLREEQRKVFSMALQQIEEVN